MAFGFRWRKADEREREWERTRQYYGLLASVMCGIGMGMGMRGLERRTARMNHLSPWAGRNKSAHLSCIGETCHALCRCGAESALVSGGDGDSAPLPLVGMGPLVGCVWDRVGNTVLGLSGIGFWVGVGYMGGAWGGV